MIHGLYKTSRVQTAGLSTFCLWNEQPGWNTRLLHGWCISGFRFPLNSEDGHNRLVLHTSHDKSLGFPLNPVDDYENHCPSWVKSPRLSSRLWTRSPNIQGLRQNSFPRITWTPPCLSSPLFPEVFTSYFTRVSWNTVLCVFLGPGSFQIYILKTSWSLTQILQLINQLIRLINDSQISKLSV